MEQKPQELITCYANQVDSGALINLHFYDGVTSKFELLDFFTKDSNIDVIKDELLNLKFELIKDGHIYRCPSTVEDEKRLRRTSIIFKNDEYKLTLKLYGDYVAIHYVNPLALNFIQDVLVPLFKKYHIDVREKPILKMLIESPNGIAVTSFETKEQELDMDNYNEDFVNANEKISEFMSDVDRSGLVLLHGTPGTGKTSYIRSLISKYRKNSFIYVPNDMIEVIVRPDFLPIIAQNPKSVIILEDCERLIMSRDSSTTTMGVSNILNMTDGLLSDCLKMKIIATFNSDVDKIDAALRRPGRLAYEYEFKYLNQDRVKKLLDKYNIKKEINKDKQYSLADIYSDTQTGFIIPQKKSFGFQIDEPKGERIIEHV